MAMHTRYRVNIVDIADMNDIYTLSCQHRFFFRYDVDITIYEMIRNSAYFACSSINRNVLSFRVPQSEYTVNAKERSIWVYVVSLRKRKVYASNSANTGEFCVRVLVTLQYTHIVSHRI